jgi:hypothetical protein
MHVKLLDKAGIAVRMRARGGAIEENAATDVCVGSATSGQCIEHCTQLSLYSKVGARHLRVVLPAPEAPMRQVTSPGLM